MSRWDITKTLTELLKVRRYDKERKDGQYREFNSELDYNFVDVSGYDYYFRLEYVAHWVGSAHISRGMSNGQYGNERYKAVINVDEEELKIYKQDGPTSTFSLSQEFKDILDGSNDELTFSVTNDSMRVLVVLSGLSIRIDAKQQENDSGVREYASGYILIKELN